MKMRPEINNR